MVNHDRRTEVMASLCQKVKITRDRIRPWPGGIRSALQPVHCSWF